MTHIPVIRPNECDDFRVLCPVKSITIDKVNSSTNDLEKNIYDLLLLLDSNPDSITTEQSEKVLVDAVSTVETFLMSFLYNIKIQKSPQLRSIATYPSKENALFSLFYDYTQFAVKVYNQKIFYNPAFFSFIIFFTNLCYYYIEIFQNPNSISLKKDFQSAWNFYYTISTRIQFFFHNVDIASQFRKFEEKFDQSEILKLNQISENSSIIYDISQSLQVVMRDIRFYDKDENKANSIQNIMIDLESLRSNFMDLKSFASDVDKYILSGKIYAVNSLLVTLESCLSFTKLYEMSNKLNALIRNDVFTLPNDIVKSDYNNWVCFKLAMQAVQLNLKIIISIRYILNEVDLKVISSYKLLKQIMPSIIESADNPDLGEMIARFLEDMKQVNPLNEKMIYQNFITFYEEQLESILKIFDEKYSGTVKGYFDNFKSYSQLSNDQKTLVTETNRFNFFLNFEDCYRSLLATPQGDSLKFNESYSSIRYYLQFDVMCCSNQKLLSHVQNIYGNLSGNSEFYNSIEKKRNLKSMWETMLNLINSLCPEEEEDPTKESDKFLTYFQLFLKASLTVLDLNEKDKTGKYDKVISYIFSSFPKVEKIRSYIQIQKRIEDLRFYISDIQSQIVKINEIVFQQGEKRDGTVLTNIKDTPDTILVQFYECEIGITKISQSLKYLEMIRQCIQFFTIYESFITTYEVESTLPVTQVEPAALTSLIYDYFPHFINEIIYMIKSPYLTINVTPSFTRKLIGFIRSLIINDITNRKEIFSKIINEMPFIDYSKLYRMAFLNFLKIDSLVRQKLETLKSEAANEPELFVQTIVDKEKKYIDGSYHLKKWIMNLVVSFKADNSIYDSNNNNFISNILQISPDLHQSVIKYWNKLIIIFRFYEKFNLLIKTAQDIRNDLQIEKKEFPKKAVQYINFIQSISLTLSVINKSSYITNELRIITTEINAKLNEVRLNFKFLFYDDPKQLEESIFVPLMLIMQELENELLQEDIHQFTNALRTVIAKSLPVISASVSDQSYSRFEEIVSDILQQIENIEVESCENKFTILFEIKQKVKQFKFNQEPLFVEFYKAMKKELNSEIYINFLKSQISIHNMIILQIASESHNIIELFTDHRTSIQQILYLPPICQVPEISRKFESIIGQISSQKKSLDDDDDAEKGQILDNLAAELLTVKNAAESHVRKIIAPAGISMVDIARTEEKTANYRKLVTLYKSKLDLLFQLREETRPIKMRMNELLGQIQSQIAEANQDCFRLKFEMKKLAEIDKTQVEYFNKPAIENLQWAKRIYSVIVPKNAERRKVMAKSMNPVLPVIKSEIQKENPLPKNAKVSYAMIVEVEQRFQKAVEKNKKLWEKAKSFTKTEKIEDVKQTLKNEEVQPTIKNETTGSFKECQDLVKNGEIVKEFKSTVQTVYELFSRSNFLQQILFSAENGDHGAAINSFLSGSGGFSGSSSSSGGTPYSSALSSGNINTSSVAGGIGNSTCDDEEIMDMMDAFNNELFERSMNFYFINKILQRKNEKKSRRKIKVKKHRKSALRDILDDEIQNQ